METAFTPEEDEVLKKMYEKLAKVFGITMMNGYVTLRFNDNENNLCQVTMRIDDLDDGKDTVCHLCHRTVKEKYMYDAEVTIGHCVEPDTFTVKLCYDCYCPK